MYYIFAGSHFYPSGGWSDFRGSCLDFDGAVLWIAKHNPGWDWWQIVDSATATVVLEHRNA